MTMNRKHQAGLHNVGSYQVSGIPWVTGSTINGNATEHKFEFPFVTQNIKLWNTGSKPCRVHFNTSGDGEVISAAGHHYITLQPSGSVDDSTNPRSYLELNVKCKEIFITGIGGAANSTGIEMFAELTGIPADAMFTLSGRGLTTGDGT